MTLKNIAAVLAVSLGLAACQTPAGTYTDVHTGTNAIHSSSATVHDGLLTTMRVMVGWSNKRGYQIHTDYMGTGTGWAFFDSAWSYGQQLPYKKLQSIVLGCAAGCTTQETGMVAISDEMFSRGLASGLQFRLMGSGGSLVIDVPSRLFKEVADRQV